VVSAEKKAEFTFWSCSLDAPSLNNLSYADECEIGASPVTKIAGDNIFELGILGKLVELLGNVCADIRGSFFYFRGKSGAPVAADVRPVWSLI